MATTTHQHHTTQLRKKRIRTALATHQEVPRLTVFRSLRHIYVQIIDDQNGRTLASVNDKSLSSKGNKTEVAQAVGSKIAELAKEKKISAVRFDRGSYKFHGRIAALAEAARSNGLKF